MTVDSPKSDSPGSRRRWWLFRVGLLLAVWLVCEGLSAIGLRMVGRNKWHEVGTNRDQIALATSERKPDQTHEAIIHPYVGWVHRPVSEGTAPVSEFGFPDADSPLVKRKSGHVSIAIIGGSVAEEFAGHGSATLCEHLKQSPQFQGQQLQIVRLALPGYKQPQQLMLVTYLLVLGAEFDVVVNIDGFNEIVLPEVENVPNHVFAAFPRGWQVRVLDSDDISVMRLVGQVAYLRDSSQRRAALFSRRPWRWSPTAAVVWLLLQQGHQEQVLRVHRDLQIEYKRQHRVALGPAQSFNSQDQLFRHCAAIWKNGSQLLHNTCRQRGTRYLHFLQPNQYVAGSKPLMSPDERNEAMSGTFAGRPAVEQGYPHLQQAGEELKAEGVEFHNLTQLFLDESVGTYRDNCCHLNVAGNRILAKRIAEVMLSASQCP